MMGSKSVTAALLVTGTAALWSGDALGWESANRWGGSTSHTYGDTSRENRWGGSSSYQAGQGAEHTNVYGGSTYGAYGAGAAHTYPSGATAYRPPGYAGYPAYRGYPAYHPPVAVPYYSSGCYGCAAAAGAVAGVAAGAAMGAAATSANSAASYSSGYAAGAATTPAGYAIGMSYAALPPGSTEVNRGGRAYYVNGNSWFQ